MWYTWNSTHESVTQSTTCVQQSEVYDSSTLSIYFEYHCTGKRCMSRNIWHRVLDTVTYSDVSVQSCTENTFAVHIMLQMVTADV